MTVYELTRDQLEELKQHILTEDMIARDEEPSYYELSIVDELISDARAFAEYADTDFSNDDFFCTAWQ